MDGIQIIKVVCPHCGQSYDVTEVVTAIMDYMAKAGRDAVQRRRSEAGDVEPEQYIKLAALSSTE